jgi:hypothetical protein
LLAPHAPLRLATTAYGRDAELTHPLPPPEVAPPAWDDPPADLGPDWDALAQPSPEYVFNQEVQW